MTALRIAHVITRLTPGGAEQAFCLIGETLRQEFQVRAVAGRCLENEEDSFDRHGDRFDAMHRIPALQRNLKPWHDLLALIQLYTFMRQHPIDVLHTHTSKAGFLGRLAAKMAGIPVVVHSTHGHIFNPQANIPGVSDRAWKRGLFMMLERWLSAVTDQVLTLSCQERQDLLELGIASANMVRVCPSPWDPKRFPTKNNPLPVMALKLPTEKPLIAIAGRLAGEKGHPFLFRAFSQFRQSQPQARLLVIGDGPLRSTLESQAQSLDSEGIVFLGSRHDLAEIYQHVDALVLASSYEGQGLSLLEAMACQVPVVATKVGGVPELIEDQKEGFLVSYGDEMALAEAMKRATTPSPSRDDMIQRAWHKAQGYQPQTIADFLSKLYRSLALKKGRPC